MKHRTFKLFASAVILAALTSFTALAATAINSVNFTFTIDGDTNIADGYNEPTIDISSQYGYEVFDCTVSASDTSLASGKNPVSYTLTLTADRGYYFPNANSIQVTGNGITEITKKSTSGWDNSELTIKFKAYPYVRLAAPSFETDFDSVKGSKSKSQSGGRDTSVSIYKNGASKIEFVVSYVDQDGEYRTKGGSVTGSTIQVGSYNKQYTGSSKYKQSAYIRGIAIRAADAKSSNPHLAPSKWVYISGGINGIDTDEYFTDYSTWYDALARSGGSGSTTSPSTGGSAGGNVSGNGWQVINNYWYYFSNGRMMSGWVYDGSNWYYCNPQSGAMMAGWIQDPTGHWFLLNQAHDGSYGRLLTGWQQDGGRWFYLNPNHDGTFGALQTGWLNVNGQWYYLNPNHDGSFGAVMTGWLNLNGAYYYLDPNSGNPRGVMTTGTKYIDGRVRIFGSDGVLIR